MENKIKRNMLMISMEFGCLLTDYLVLDDMDTALQYLEEHIEEWAAEFEDPEVQNKIYGDEYTDRIEQFARWKFQEAGWLPAKNRTMLLCRQVNTDGGYPWFQYVLYGKITKEQEEKIRACCKEGKYFIPSKVGLPPLKGLYPDQNVEMFGIGQTGEAANVALTIDELLESFENAAMA